MELAKIVMRKALSEEDEIESTDQAAEIEDTTDEEDEYDEDALEEEQALKEDAVHREMQAGHPSAYVKQKIEAMAMRICKRFAVKGLASVAKCFAAKLGRKRGMELAKIVMRKALSEEDEIESTDQAAEIEDTTDEEDEYDEDALEEEQALKEDAVHREMQAGHPSAYVKQ